MQRSQATLAALTAVSRARSVDELLQAALDAAFAAVPSEAAAIDGPHIAGQGVARGEAEVRSVAAGVAARPGATTGRLDGRPVVVVGLAGATGPLGQLAAVPAEPFDPVDAEDRLAQVAAHVGLALDRFKLAEQLTRSRDQLAAVLANVSDGITATTPNGMLMYANAAAARLAGFDDPEEYLRTPVAEVTGKFDLIGPDGGPASVESLPSRRAWGGAPAEGLIGWRPRGQGEERWAHLRAVPVLDEAGAVQIVVNVTRDVTDERHEQRVRAFLTDATAVLASSLDYETTLREVACLAVPRVADWCSVRLLTPEGDIEPVAAEHTNPQHRALAVEWARKYPVRLDAPSGAGHVIRTGEPEFVPAVPWELIEGLIQDPAEREMVRALGLHSAITVPLRAGGRILGAMSFVNGETRRSLDARDLELATQLADRAGVAIENARLYTEAETARARADGERERLLVTLRSIGDAVLVTDSAGAARLLNPIAEAMTGWTQAEAEGRSLDEVMPLSNETTGAVVVNPVEVVLQTGLVQGLANHTVLRARDGTVRAIEDSAAPIRSADGETLGVVLVFRDVTARRRLDSDMARASRIDALGVLAGGIAHDFNNLLASVVGNLSLVERKLPVDHPVRERVIAAAQACDRGKDLTRQLLTFASGGAPLKAATSLEQVVRETVAFALQGSRTDVQFGFPEDLWPVQGDYGQLSQLFQNLVINADQAMSAGGTVTITAENAEIVDEPPLAPGRYVRVVVRDQGPGIPPGVAERIFDPFFTTKPAGSGLGLATAYSIAKRHDGRISLLPSRRGGAAFVVCLPASESHAAARQDQGADALPGRGRVLVMDDDASVLELARACLEHLGYEAELASSGREAVDLYAKAQAAGRRFDAVILDLTVPGGDGGLSAIRKLIALDPDVRGIVSSGYSNDPVMARYADHGFSAVLAKPYRLEDLGKVLTALVGAKSGV